MTGVNEHMTRYADPYLCPDCHARLPVGVVVCPACALPLQGPLAVELFATLRNADRLLSELRASALPAGPAVPGLPATPVATPGAGPVAAPAVASPRRGLRSASVPTILLGLGALCLLVAAVTFLAVAWSWLDVGGRTAVLVALTVAAGALGTWLGGRELRLAAEALTTVSLGLLVLDVVGADNAGWFGDLGTSGLVCLVGAALGTASLALTFAPRRLVSPQLGAALGLWLVVAGAAGVSTHEHVVFGIGVLAFAALAALGRARRAPATSWAAFAGGWTWWVALAGSGLAEAADHASLRGLWVEGHGWSLLAASALLLVPVAFAPSRTWVLQLCGAASATLATVTLVVPAADEDLTTFTVVALACLLGWSTAAVVAPTRLARVPLGPIALAALPVAVVSVGLLGQGTTNVLAVGDPFTLGPGARLDPAETIAHPALLLPSLLGLLVALVVAGLVAPPRKVRLPWPALGAGVLVLGGVGTLALESVPLWAVTAALCLVAGALVADAQRRTGARSTGTAAAGAVAGLAALVAALPSDWLTAAVAVVLTTAAAVLTGTGRTTESRVLGGLLLPAAAATLLWSAANVADVSQAWRAAPVLLVVGVLAILLPRVELELTAGVTALVTGAVSVSAATDQAESLALHLTIAGALVSASALKNPGRRLLGWPGGFLLALATWVRLWDLGVGTPEAYTLPSAVALLLLGLDRLRRDPDASTVLALGPALTLATTPSLLWVLAGDPVSLRAALLGAGCLGLVLAGTRLRWSSPLVVGAVVGGLLVLRELAPYAAATPQWVLIGLAGTVLTVVGVTWERRLRDLRQAADYLVRLR